ncbi:MAG: S1/P1 nuclease [Hyphomonadaceae bacterium]|nr:S1/P1 nuclease [Hyphomonadaceae bacterium]
MRRLCLLTMMLTMMFLACAAAPALAWGGQGHRLIAELAYARLTPAARAEADRLLATGAARQVDGCMLVTFADAATWPDCARSRDPFRATYEEHFDDIPLFGRTAKRAYCPNRVCATEAIKRHRAVLADRRASDGARLEALSFLVHYIGDIHQPLHAADNHDRGGNDVKVIYLGAATYRSPFNGEQVQNNLHGVWDTPLVSAALRADGGGRADIERLVDGNLRRWSAFAPDRWARESHALAVREAYGRLPAPMSPNAPPSVLVEIDPAYVDGAVPVVKEQLARAAVRTAAALNATLR